MTITNPYFDQAKYDALPAPKMWSVVRPYPSGDHVVGGFKSILAALAFGEERFGFDKGVVWTITDKVVG